MTTDPTQLDAVAKAAELIARSDGLLVAAGAGMGVDSGLPDFRGSDGFWRAYPALGRARLSFQEVATPATFIRDPALAWGFYGHRLKLYRVTVPHAGFGILRRWAEGMKHGGFVFTSNVDGQFQKAGFSAETIYECHGSIHVLQCSALCGTATWLARDLDPVIDEASCRWTGPLPVCPGCGAIARLNILMFEDLLWDGSEYAIQNERLRRSLEVAEHPVVVELGAGTSVPSVRSFSENVSRRPGCGLIRINPREAMVPSERHASLPTSALEGLTAIDAALARLRSGGRDTPGC